MEIKDIKAVYFVGAGGIGMSAIARYFLNKKLVVAGYDKTPSNLTHELEKEGMLIHYEENVDLIPEACKDAKTTLVVYTPAIPAEHKELVFFHENNFTIEKRAQVLGTLTRTHKGLCVAGTHGKTSTSTMCAHIMHQSHVDCNAFLGGISKNYGTNLLLSQKKALTRSLKQTSSTVLSIGYPLICPLSRPQIPTIWIFTVQNRPIWKVSSITQLSFNRAVH